MSYVLSYSPLNKAHLKALAVTPDELRAFAPHERAEMLLRYAEVEAAQREAFWNVIQGVAAGLLPIVVFLGLTKKHLP